MAGVDLALGYDAWGNLVERASSTAGEIAATESP